MTVLENVLVSKYACDKGSYLKSFLGLKSHGSSNLSMIEESLSYLEFVGIAHLKGHLAENLSYGDQRRLEIARALATKPDLLFLDEPTAGMNPHETKDAIQLFIKIKQNGVTIILIEHDMKVVSNCCDRVVVLEYGKKLAEGTPIEVKRSPEVIKAYLGKGDYHAQAQ
jgi:branched-chain amino acid transport system ATP-binding protein